MKALHYIAAETHFTAGTLIWLKKILIKYHLLFDCAVTHLLLLRITSRICNLAFVLKIFVFWDLTSCSLVEMCQRFGGASYLHLQGRLLICSGGRVWQAHQKRWCLSATVRFMQFQKALHLSPGEPKKLVMSASPM
jgi:hypothetical protein